MMIFIVCFLVYFALLISTPLLIYPEFFFYPWLVAKGLTQYRDFFDHHGFLTNFLFAPFAHSLQLVSFVFIVLQVIQFCILAYLLRKKVKNWLAYLMLLVLYLSFQYTIVAQQIWYDAIMALFVLLSWFLFEKKKEYEAWMFLAFASMIKPTVLLFTAPFFLKSKNKKSIYASIVLWLIAVGYFVSRGAVGELWRQLILFNFAYGKSIYKTFSIGISYRLLAVIIAGFAVLLFFAIKQKRKNIPLILTALISSVFFSFGFAKLNFAMFVPFFILLLAELFQHKKLDRHAFLILFIFTFIIVRDAYKTYKICLNKQIYITSSVVREAKELDNLIKEKKDKHILVIGNHVELYYFLNVLPNEFVPIHFPWIIPEYPNNVKLDGMIYVIVPKKLGQYEAMSTATRTELKKDYRQVGQTTSYTVWRYNKE